MYVTTVVLEINKPSNCSQVERAKLEQELSGTREALQSALKKSKEFEEKLRILQEKANHAKQEGEKNVEKFLQQVPVERTYDKNVR